MNPGWLRSHNGNLSHFVKLSLAFVAAGLRQIFAPGRIESKTTKLFKFLHLKIFFCVEKKFHLGDVFCIFGDIDFANLDQLKSIAENFRR